MSKTIIFSLLLAAVALMCSATSVFFEVAAETNRFLAQGHNVTLYQQNNFQKAKLYLLLIGELRQSEIHSQPLFKSRTDFLNWKKEAVFIAATDTLRKESAHMKKINFENILLKDIKDDAFVLIDDINLFLNFYDSEEYLSLNAEQFKEKFYELQGLIERMNSITSRQLKKRNKLIQKYSEQAQALSVASTYLIFSAFILEILIFFLVQYLEIRTERRLR